MGKPCICGSGRPFAHCCDLYLKGTTGGVPGETIRGNKFAPTAEALMRSRYTAFVLGNIDYLLATHHLDYHSSDRASLQKSIQTTLRTTEWINLIVLDIQKGQRKDKIGSVEFVAAYRSKQSTALEIERAAEKGSPNAIAQLHEKSQFVREGAQWFYTKGELLAPYQPKRSQPCWCGSSLKFRQCHGS